MHCLTAWGQWAVELLQYTATPPGDGGQWNSCNARTHQLGRWGVLPRRQSLPKERNSCNALPHCLGATGGGSSAMHYHTVLGQWALELLQCTTTLPGGSAQWAVELLQCTATLPGGSGQCNSCNALLHCLGASWGDGEPYPRAGRCLKSGTRTMHCHTAWGRWAMKLLLCAGPPAGVVGSPA